MRNIKNEDLKTLKEYTSLPTMHCDCCHCAISENDKCLKSNITGEIWCEECSKDYLFFCDICGKIEQMSRSHTTQDTHKHICRECYRSNLVHSCYECGRIFENPNSLVFDPLNTRRFCDKCYAKTIIRAYDFKPDIDFWFEKNEEKNNNGLMLGFELEVENYNENGLSNGQIARVLDKEINEKYFKDKKFLYFKRDGSLNNGFEIVSKPFSECFFRRNKNLFREILTYLSEYGCKSHDTTTCGLHFHINRKFLNSEDTIDKMILFTEYYQDKIKSFSRRENYRYCEFLSNKTNKFKNDYAKRNIKLIHTTKNEVDRYSVVNIKNRNTVEIRVFRGTLKPETFLATTEFVFNLSNVVKNFEIKQISWNKVINFVDSYKELKNYVKSRNIEGERSFMRDYSIDFVKSINKARNKLKAIKFETFTELYNIYTETLNDMNKQQPNKNNMLYSIARTKPSEEKTQKITKSIKNLTNYYHILHTISMMFSNSNDYYAFYDYLQRILSFSSYFDKINNKRTFFEEKSNIFRKTLKEYEDLFFETEQGVNF